MFSSRVWFLASVAAVAAVTGCGPSDPGTPQELGEAAQAIIGGTLDQSDPAVVAIAERYQGVYYQYCTGTLIAPKTVLTAAHCVDQKIVPYIVFGTYVDQPSSSVQVAQQIRHSGFSNNTLDDDIALLRLSSAVTAVAPIDINTTAPYVGQAIRHVGYGVTNAQQQSGSGAKREVTYSIRAVYQAQIESGASGKQTCQGDSGGPGLVQDAQGKWVVAGIVSYGDQYCAQEGIDTRVDAYTTWIQQTMAPWEAPTCAEDGKCKAGCTPIDVDCACAADGVCSTQCPEVTKDPDCPKDCAANGVCAVDACPFPDTDCRDEGTTCTTDMQCLWRQCVGDPQHAQMYCSRACTDSTQCPLSGMECAGDGLCKWKQKTTANIGEACTQDTYCLNGGICTGATADQLTCSIPCNGEGGICPAVNQTCVLSPVTSSYYCATNAPTGGGGGGGGSSGGPVYMRKASVEGPAASGCSSSGGGTPLWLAALAVAFVLIGRRRAVQKAAVAAVAVAVLGCGVDLKDDAALGKSAQEIVGGSVDSGDPEVFLLEAVYNNGQAGYCSSTLIGKRTLVTAAHCADPAMANATSVQIRAENKTYASTVSGTDWFYVTQVRIHPSWSPNTSLNNDIALLLLDRAPPVAMKAWNQASMSGTAGKTVRAVGYGITSSSASDSGTKRQVSLALNYVDSDHLYLGNGSNKGICHGDSGGPTFYTFPDGVERLVGIHSYDANGQCTSGADIRIDYYQAFVNQWLTEKEGPQCSADGQCKQGCTPYDVDCYCVADGTCNAQCPNLLQDPDCPKDCVANGVCALQACPVADVDCVAEGGACTSEQQCKGRVCISDPQHPQFYCSRACTTSAECPTGMECASGANVCRYPQLSEADPGQTCTVGGTYCRGGTVCTGISGGPTKCEQPCTTNADCAGDATCESGQGFVKFCRSPYKPPIYLKAAKVDGAPMAQGCSAAGGAPLGLLVVALGGLLRRRIRG